MNRTKSSAQTNLSKPISITSQFRFEKVEQLTSFINDAVQTPSSRNNVGDKVLEMLKNHIKTNYDHLYQNYGDNKKKILKHIQAVQTNIAGENAMNSRFDQLVKDKSRYDRLHAEVGDKQRKLKKLNEIKQKINDQLENLGKSDSNVENNSKIADFEEQKQELEHQALVLKEIFSVRQKIQLALREKQISLNEDMTQKKQKFTRLCKQNEKRVQLHKKMIAELQKDEQMEIPVKLAEELSLKMEMYENKYSYNSIIGHETVLEEKRFAKLKDGVRVEREQQRAQKLKKESEEKSQLEQLYSIAQIKSIQQEKINKYCAVETIQEVYDANNVLNTQKIQKLTAQIEEKIAQLSVQNKEIEQRLEQEINNQSENATKENIYDVQLELGKQEKQKDQLNETLKKWESVSQNWKIILGLLELQPNKSSLSSFLASIDEEIKNKSTSDSRENGIQTNIKHYYDDLL